MARLSQAIAVIFFLTGLNASPDFAQAHRLCPERPKCKGCGCKGGPGWRGPPRANGKNGRCVGFKNINRICGIPHSKRCVFENAPGTGTNKSCAHSHKKKRQKINKKSRLNNKCKKNACLRY